MSRRAGALPPALSANSSSSDERQAPLNSPITLPSRSHASAAASEGARLTRADSTRSGLVGGRLTILAARPRFSSMSAKSMNSTRQMQPEEALPEEDVVAALAQAVIPEDVESVLLQCARSVPLMDSERNSLVPSILSAMRRFLDKPAVCSAGCKALVACGRTHAAALDSAETPRLVVDAITLYRGNEAIWEPGLKVLAINAGRLAANIGTLVELRVPEVICDSLPLFDSSSPVVALAASLINKITQHEASQEAVFDMGVASAMCLLLERSAPSVQGACLDCLAHFAANAHLRDALFEQTNSTLSKALGNPRAPPNLSARVLLVVVSLALSPSVRLSMNRYGIPRFILDVLSSHRNHATVTQLGCESLCFLSLTPDARPALLRQGVILRMLDAVRHHTRSAEICFPALAVLRHVTEGSKDACTTLVSTNGLQTLADVIGGDGVEDKIRAEAMAVIANVAEVDPFRVTDLLCAITSSAVGAGKAGFCREVCRGLLAASHTTSLCSTMFDRNIYVYLLASLDLHVLSDSALAEYALKTLLNISLSCEYRKTWDADPISSMNRCLNVRDGDVAYWALRVVKFFASQEPLQLALMDSPGLVDSIVACARAYASNVPTQQEAMAIIGYLAFNEDAGPSLIEFGCGDILIECATRYANDERLKEEARLAAYNLGLDHDARKWLLDRGVGSLLDVKWGA